MSESISDVEQKCNTLLRYTRNINEVKHEIINPFDGLVTSSIINTGVMACFPLLAGSWNSIKNNKPYASWKYKKENNLTYREAWKTVGENRANSKKELEYLTKDCSIWSGRTNKSNFKKLEKILKEIPTITSSTDVSTLKGKELIKYNNTKLKAGYYKEAKDLIEEAKNKKMKGAELKKQIEKIKQAMAKGDIKVNEALQKGDIKQTSKLKKLNNYLKSKTGVYKLENTMLKSRRGATALKLGKAGLKCGPCIMAILEGVFEIEDIVNAFKADKEENADKKYNNRGKTQLMKSGVKVGTSVLGYAAGAAATGAAVGSIFPGIGTFVGGVIGMLGGFIGGAATAYVTGEIMDNALGEKDALNTTEYEKYLSINYKKESKKADEDSKKVANSLEQQFELLNKVKEISEKEGFRTQEEQDAYVALAEKYNKAIQERAEQEQEIEQLYNQLNYLKA